MMKLNVGYMYRYLVYYSEKCTTKVFHIILLRSLRNCHTVWTTISHLLTPILNPPFFFAINSYMKHTDTAWYLIDLPLSSFCYFIPRCLRQTLIICVRLFFKAILFLQLSEGQQHKKSCCCFIVYVIIYISVLRKACFDN